MLEGIRTIGVVGAGQMGSGIAQVAATAGFGVVLRDVEDKILERAVLGIRESLGRLVAKGKLEESQADSASGRVETTTALADLRRADYIVEAIVEDAAVKRQLFADMDRIARPGVILASNTSSIPVTLLGSATARPGLVAGMHFFNPVPRMPLVEVIRGHDTEETTVLTVVALAEALGKTPVEVRDFPGFVSNRILMPMLNEAMFARLEGVGTTRAIDTVMMLGMNHPMGPLQLADYIGLDTCLFILELLQRELGDPKYRPCPLLRQMVNAGHLGRKTGRGFYNWESGKATTPADEA